MTITSDPARSGFFDGVFARGSVAGGGAAADDAAWLRSMLAAEAALARALERAGLAPAGAGAAVTGAAHANDFGPAEVAELGRATVPLRRSISAREVGPGISVTRLRRCGSPGPPAGSAVMFGR